MNRVQGKTCIVTGGAVGIGHACVLRLAEEGRPYRLAVSLHGSTEEERSALVPASRKWPPLLPLLRVPR